MNTLGWQIGAVLFGASFFIIAIYLAKVLNSVQKLIEKTDRLIDVNERHVTEIVENVSHITKSVENIMDIVSKITNLVKVFKFFKK